MKKVLGVVAAVVLGVFLALGFATPAGATTAECVPSEAWTEVITPEVPATPDTWQRYSWTGGKWKHDYAPPFPGEPGDWTANVAGDPHGIGVEGPYYRSHGNSGNGDWFYLERVPGEPGVPAVVVEHPAVVCETPEPESNPEPTLTPIPAPETPTLADTGASGVEVAVLIILLTIIGGVMLRQMGS